MISADNRKDEYFKDLFFEYYESLCFYTYKYIPDFDICEDIVQDVFFNLWENKDKLDLSYSMKSLLYKSTQNKALNYIKSHEYGHKERLDNSVDMYFYSLATQQDEELHTENLIKEIDEVVTQLPKQCNKIFLLSREAGLKNKEIAEQLNISVKAVEKQLTKALSIIRTHLYEKGYFLLLFLIALYILND